MTTIVATVDTIAADTQVTTFAGRRPAKSYERKLYRAADAVIGAAGDATAIDAFVLWWPKRERARFELPKGRSFAALVLHDGQIYKFEDSELPQVVTTDCAAVGSGSNIALAAISTMKALGKKPDPRVAVCVATEHDLYSGGRIEWMVVKKRRGR